MSKRRIPPPCEHRAPTRVANSFGAPGAGVSGTRCHVTPTGTAIGLRGRFETLE